MTDRVIRQAPEQAAFDQRSIPVTLLSDTTAGPWHRLYRKEFANQFFPSPGSRLTPESGKFPCVYLASSRLTTVAEVWAGRMAAHRDLGREVHVIPLPQAERWAYLEVSNLPGNLRLCDLTDSATRLATGLDAGTLYASDLAIPRAWAERIARHPARFDAIRYRGRHTDELCLVLWDREGEAPPRLSERLHFETTGEFAESDEAHELAAKIGIRVSFAW